MKGGKCAMGIILLVAAISAGCSDWRGFGFHARGPEIARLRQVLALKAGMSVADVGAGNGELTLALATEVGTRGRVFATEIDAESIEEIRAAVAKAKVDNVTVVQAQARDTGLPAGCCDAVILRRVYHHLTNPVETDASLLRALRPSGTLAVIDFAPPLPWLWPWPPNGVPKNRAGHGVAAQLVVGEVTASGFELVRVFDDWPGRWPLSSYCAVFRKPMEDRPANARL